MSDQQNDVARLRMAKAPRILAGVIFGSFAWIIVGICLIYGTRMWFNSNVSTTFLPITGAAFCSALSFTIVLALEYATGPIKLKLSGSEFQGASGPIILWCFCFFVISFGLYVLGFADLVKENLPPDPRSILQLIFRAKQQVG